MPKYRIAHIITRLCVGGAQENTFHTVRLADRDRFTADLISGPTEGGEGSIEPAVLAAGIDLIREPHLVRAPAPHRDWLALRGLTRTLRAGRYDLVHTHTSKAGFLGRIAAARAGIPHVVHTSHGNVFDGYFNRPLAAIFTGLERYAARHTSRFIELTPGGVEAHLERGIGRREQFRVVFSGIDPAPFEDALARRAETRASLGVSGDQVLVGGVGRLAPVKGFAYFVEMARALATELPGVRFVLAGDGEESARLQAQAGGVVRLLGMRGDIPAIMAALDILVVPSLNEGMGRVILEAGAAGVPVVASRTGGIPDIVDDGVTGVLVAPRSAGELATAVRGLVHSPERRQGMGAAARARILPHYSLAAMVQRIEAIYEELLHAHPPDPRR
ncbi:MAG: glycosyltransferase family 4 protein [Candidatus Hydrogenedentes bacterium]|nr:glycosyltransferase family 4 protein [Candidatus Hydrogenedentota bacterium]